MADDTHTPSQPSPNGTPVHDSAYEKDLDTPMILLVGIVFALVVFVAIFFLQGYFYRVLKEEEQRKVVAQRPQELLAAQTAQEEKLHSYGWVDRQKGVVSIPIELAMPRALAQLKAQQGRSPAVATPQAAAAAAPDGPAAATAAPNNTPTQN